MRHVVAALIVDNPRAVDSKGPGPRILICQRIKDQFRPLKWEFPGGKIEDGEQPPEALRRELEEELGIRANIGAEIAHSSHVYPDGRAVDLRFYLVRDYQQEIQNLIFNDIRWVALPELPNYDFLDADIELVRRLASGALALD